LTAKGKILNDDIISLNEKKLDVVILFGYNTVSKSRIHIITNGFEG
jgi:hypothetical protein